MSDGPRGDQVIRTPDQRLRVFVSSTLEELAAERRSVCQAVTALRLTPVMFELGARPHPPRQLYRAYLAQSQVFVGLYWQHYGQVGPGMERSGLEEEFEEARALPRLLYVKAPAPNREPRLDNLLSRIEQEVSYRTFHTAAELRRLVREDLAALLSERFATGAPQAGAPPRMPVARGPRPLPVATTSLIGREREIDEVAGLVGRPDARLVTLIGPGGIGKTRLAMAAGERLRDRFGPRIAFVPLAGVARPELVLAAMGQAMGTELGETESRLRALVEYIGDSRWLLVLDNLEHAVDVAGDLGELLTRCPEVAILATSLTALRLRTEREYPVQPLPLPPDPATVQVDELLSSPAVALFVDRARAVRHDFALTPANAPAVAEICRRLEGLPLAIELAAARIRLLDPDTLLRRLARSLDALGAGAADMPERQQTLRATVEWSVGLLDDAERSLLETTAVFVGGWTIEAAAEVAALDEERVLDLTEALARHSLVSVDITDHGPRARMLETIREFVAEQLAARPDAGEIRRRHAGHYRALTEQADRPLRLGQSEWAERLQAETGNLTAALDWHAANDPAPLPHLFRVLALFWIHRDPMGVIRSCIDQLLPAADTLDPQARAELLWTAANCALEAGDDGAALAARERLAPLLDGISDPYLKAVSHLEMAWTSPLAGDVDGILRWALVSLEQLRGQDEPVWTAAATATAVDEEVAVGRHEDALRHLHELHDLAERLNSDWFAAWSRMQLGTLAVMQGRFDEARARLDEGLSLSPATRSTPLVAMCLGAFARLALAEGNPERAALLTGAADGLRRRAGVRAWPVLRRPEAELLAQVRQALGGDRFDRVFAAGSRLSQREALAAVRSPRSAGTQAS